MIETVEVSTVGGKENASFRGMLVTDLDGTLLNSRRKLQKQDYKTLQTLGKRGYARAVATGRHLHSFFKVADDDFPIDYVIFSSGAGIWDFHQRKIIRKVTLETAEVERAAGFLISRGLDFMVHKPIPENHMFFYYSFDRENRDFERRVKMYEEFSEPLLTDTERFDYASQLLAIEPPESDRKAYDIIREKLSEYTVLRTTSPLDGSSTWIEIFPQSVSKSRTACWLAQWLGLEKEKILSIGNDYNDLDLLEWAGTSFVVANAPEELRMRFNEVSSNDEGGFSEAVRKWW